MDKLKTKLIIPARFLAGTRFTSDLRFVMKPNKNAIAVGMPQIAKTIGRKHEMRFINAGPGTGAQSGKYSQLSITQIEITIAPIRQLPNNNAAFGQLLMNVRVRDVISSNVRNLVLNEAANGSRYPLVGGLRLAVEPEKT